MSAIQEGVHTYLLPVSINFYEAGSRLIKAPYMGAAEYEFGAPQETWASIREAGEDLVVGELNGFFYAYNCEQTSLEKVGRILLAMTENRCYNKGLNWEKNYEGIYDTWLSMRPRFIVSRCEAIRDWMIFYAKQEVMKTNVDIHIGDQVLCMVPSSKRDSFELVSCKVVGLPEEDTLLTILHKKKKRRIPIWNCISTC